MSQLMFWNKQNNNNNNTNNGNSTTDGKNNKRTWLHTPDSLINAHVAYLVKFFGHLPVEQTKGIEVVKDAIRKLQFAQQMKKAETGTQEKYKKVEITISVDGVAVQEPRTKKILHQFRLHDISYCADEKGVKKFLGFIAKTVKPQPNADSNTNGLSNGNTNTSNAEETHECFIFISNKLASDITFTIGQAFDLAYRNFINNGEKTDLGKAQQRIGELEKTINIYKNRLREVSLKIPKAELDNLLFNMSIKDILEVPNTEITLTNGNNTIDDDKLLIDTNSTKSSNSTTSFVPVIPPRNNMSSQNTSKSNSQKMEELLLNSDSDSDFDPRADESLENSFKNNDTIISKNNNDIFGFEPAKNCGQQLFFNNNDSKFLNNNNNNNNNISNTSNSSNMSSNSFTNELYVTPPLLAPPPKVAAPRRSTSVTNAPSSNNTILTNGNTDLFGSDPFDTSSSSIFKSKLSAVSVDDFSLESLDPLKK